MTAIILLPTNSGGYEYAKIYRSTTSTGEYTLIDTINSKQLEYEDSAGNYSNYYKIAWYDGTTELEKIPVQSLAQKVINIIRISCKITSSVLPDSEIDILIDEAKNLIRLDVASFNYDVELEKLKDGYYQLPKCYYYDRNNGGVISWLDIDIYKQLSPVYEYTERTEVIPIDINFDAKWVLVPVLDNNEILKINYYETGKRLDSPEVFYQLIAYKIASIYFENLVATSISTTMSSPYSRVKIGPISVENGTSTSIGTTVNALIDFSNKMSARYNKLAASLKSGFKRVH